MDTRYEGPSGRTIRAVAGGLLFALVGAACGWEPAFVSQSVRGEGRIEVVDAETLSFEAEFELVLRGNRAQTVALDELCVAVGSKAGGFNNPTWGVLEEVEFDRGEWPVRLDPANEYTARRSLRVRGLAALSLDSAVHPCRAGEPMIRVGAALLGSEMADRSPRCVAGNNEITVELECPECTEPLTELGLEPAWEQPGDSEVEVLGSAMAVDAEGALWRVGPAASGFRQLMRSEPDGEAGAEVGVPDADIRMLGRVALAGGSLPGVIRAHAFGPSYVIEDLPEPPPEGAGGGAAGGGAAGEEPPPASPMRSLRVARSDSGGELWAHEFETYAYDFDLLRPVVAVAAGRVLVMVFGPRGLYVDGEEIAPLSSTEVHLVTLDEETGELLDFIEFEHFLLSAQGLSDGGFLASAGVNTGTFALLRLEADFAVSWLTPLPEESLELFEMWPEALSVDGAAGYWSSPRGQIYRFDWAGQIAWRVAPPGQITSMAIAPDGGLLVTTTLPTVVWIDPNGTFRGSIDGSADRSCPFQLALATGEREPAFVRGFGDRRVGRLRAAP